MKISKIGAVLGASVIALAAPLAGSAAAIADEPIVVSIVVEMDLPSDSDGPIVFAVSDITAGEGPELTEADVVDNPSEWCGSLDVDIDPVSKTIFIYTGPESQVCNFETVSVTITSAQIGAITLVEDTLFDESLCVDEEEPEEGSEGIEVDLAPVSGEFNGTFAEQVNNGVWTFDYTSESGVVQLDWATPFEGEETDSYNTCGYTVLTFAAPPVAAAPVLADTGSESSLLAVGIGAGALLLGFAAFAAASVARRQDAS